MDCTGAEKGISHCHLTRARQAALQELSREASSAEDSVLRIKE